MVYVHFDGGSLPLEGEYVAVYGFTIRYGKNIWQSSGLIGRGVECTAILAEYTALLKALKALKYLKSKRRIPKDELVRIFGDNKSVCAMVGGYIVGTHYADENQTALTPLIAECKAMLPEKARLKWISRWRNTAADALCNRELNKWKAENGLKLKRPRAFEHKLDPKEHWLAVKRWEKRYWFTQSQLPYDEAVKALEVHGIRRVRPSPLASGRHERRRAVRVPSGKVPVRVNSQMENAMSSYEKLTKNPKTGEYEIAQWMDDALGRHRYGVRFDSDPDTVYDPEFDDLPTMEADPIKVDAGATPSDEGEPGEFSAVRLERLKREADAAYAQVASDLRNLHGQNQKFFVDAQDLVKKLEAVAGEYTLPRF